jgi:hypothetical protein
MNEKKITGVRVYILTVDSETNTVLKTEEEDPNTGHRTELAPSFQAVPPRTVPARRPSPPPPSPPKPVPARPPSKKTAEHEADKGRPPKV